MERLEKNGSKALRRIFVEVMLHRGKDTSSSKANTGFSPFPGPFAVCKNLVYK